MEKENTNSNNKYRYEINSYIFLAQMKKFITNKKFSIL